MVKMAAFIIVHWGTFSWRGFLYGNKMATFIVLSNTLVDRIPLW